MSTNHRHQIEAQTRENALIPNKSQQIGHIAMHERKSKDLNQRKMQSHTKLHVAIYETKMKKKNEDENNGKRWIPSKRSSKKTFAEAMANRERRRRE